MCIRDRAGLTLRQKNPKAAWAGGMPGPLDGGMGLTAPTMPGTPLYDAGLDKGDRIVSVDGRPLADQQAWTAILSRHAPGDRLPIVYRQRGGERSTILTLAEDPTIEVMPNEKIGQPLTPEQTRFRQSWLGPRPVPTTASPVPPSQ